MKKKAKLAAYYARQDDDPTDGQEIGLFNADENGMLAACHEFLGQLGYSVYKK